MFDVILPRLKIPAISGTILLEYKVIPVTSYPFFIIHQINIYERHYILIVKVM